MLRRKEARHARKEEHRRQEQAADHEASRGHRHGAADGRAAHADEADERKPGIAGRRRTLDPPRRHARRRRVRRPRRVLARVRRRRSASPASGRARSRPTRRRASARPASAAARRKGASRVRCERAIRSDRRSPRLRRSASRSARLLRSDARTTRKAASGARASAARAARPVRRRARATAAAARAAPRAAAAAALGSCRSGGWARGAEEPPQDRVRRHAEEKPPRPFDRGGSRCRATGEQLLPHPFRGAGAAWSLRRQAGGAAAHVGDRTTRLQEVGLLLAVERALARTRMRIARPAHA
jgi:hypothetical protein